MVESDQASGHAWFKEVLEATRKRSCGSFYWKGGSSWTLKDGQDLTRRAGRRFRQLEH